MPACALAKEKSPVASGGVKASCAAGVSAGAGVSLGVGVSVGAGVSIGAEGVSIGEGAGIGVAESMGVGVCGGMALSAGIGAAAAGAGAFVLGGDLSRGPGWSVAVTVVGRAQRPVTRAGARAGDGIWVTGAVGGARAALEAWRRGDAPTPEARHAYAHPEPRIQAGRWLADHGARAMLDLSDGLGADAGHLAAASGVRIVLTLETVPVAAAAVAEARRMDLPVQQFAAEGGPSGRWRRS